MMDQIFPWKKCFCGSIDFHIQKPGKFYKIVCTKCKCTRGITTPGVSVDDYDVDIPFVEESKE